MNGTVQEFLKTVMAGLPNFAGLLIALYLMYAIISAVLVRNTALTDALIACAAR
jgi:hypothetical protein